MRRGCVRALAPIGVGLLLVVPGCGGAGRDSTPITPTAATQASPGKLRVSIKNGLSAIVVPGRTLALIAALVSPDGSTRDVTGEAVWQSSNPVAATVAGGIVSAAAEGVVEIKATYEKVSAETKIDIRRTCEAATSTLDSVHEVMTPFEKSVRVQVRVASNMCRWTAIVDGDFPEQVSNPNESGDGVFDYYVPVNTSPAQRSGRIRVVFPDKSELQHSFTQDKPPCSYVAIPAQVALKPSGGNGSFRLTATPESCAWVLMKSGGSRGDTISILSSRSGTGSATVSYRITPAFGEPARGSYNISIVGDEASPQGYHSARVVEP